VFTAHEVLIRGHSLRRIETAVQRLELSALNTLPANQRSLVPDDQPIVPKIMAKEVTDSDDCVLLTPEPHLLHAEKQGGGLDAKPMRRVFRIVFVSMYWW
jgi:hypothetical protein